MPRMDGTGPEGKGPATGRGMGRCKKKSGNDDTLQQGKGMGKGRQRGGGRGQGRRLPGGSGK